MLNNYIDEKYLIRHLEKKEVKKSALKAGIALLFSYVIVSVFPVLLRLFLKKVDIFGKNYYYLLSDSGFSQLIQIIFSILMFIVPFTLVAKLSKEKISRLIPFDKPQGDLKALFLFGLGFCGFANISVSYAGSLLTQLGFPSYDMPSGSDPTGFFGFMLTVISTAVIPPLVEEFAFRGILFGWLEKYSEKFALFATAILFGLMHRNFIQMFFAFLVGLILGFIRLKSGSIWLAVAVHAANNFFAVVTDYASQVLSDSSQSVMYLILNIAYLIIGILGLLFVTKDKEMFRLCGTKSNYLRESDLYISLFTSVPVILFSVFCIIESLLYFII